MNHIGIRDTPSLSKYIHSTLKQFEDKEAAPQTQQDRNLRPNTRRERDRPTRSDRAPGTSQRNFPDTSHHFDRHERKNDRSRSEHSRNRSRDRDRDTDRDRSRNQSGNLKRRSPQDPTRSSESSKSQKSSISHNTARSSSSSSLNANAQEFRPVDATNTPAPVALSSSAAADPSLPSNPSTLETQEPSADAASSSSLASADSAGSLIAAQPAPSASVQAPVQPAQIAPASSSESTASRPPRRTLRRPVTNPDGSTSFVRPTTDRLAVPERVLVQVNPRPENDPANPAAAVDDNNDAVDTVVID